MWRALPPTLSLMIGAMILWLTAGVLVGTVSALRRGSWTRQDRHRRVAAGLVVPGLVVPTFVLALLGGVGQALLTAVKGGDLIVVLVVVILISLVNLIADICQAVLDPRVYIT